MITILVTSSNELTVSPTTDRIMRKSNLVDNLQFLVDQIYNNMDMGNFTARLEYTLPVSKDYCSEILELSDELYKDKYQYTLPVDTKLTKEPGNIEIQINFTWAELADDGTVVSHVRKTSPTTLTVYPIAAWSDYVPDDALDAVDQRILKTDEQIAALEKMELDLANEKLDDLVVEDNKIAGTINGEKQTEWDIVVPRIDDGKYDDEYDGVLELDDFDPDDYEPDGDGDGNGGNSGNGGDDGGNDGDGGDDGGTKHKHHHHKKNHFIDLGDDDSDDDGSDDEPDDDDDDDQDEPDERPN